MTEPVILSLLDQGMAPSEPPSAPGAGVLLAAPAGWPAPPAPAAYHGLVGEIVRKLEPETEADPLAILSQLLVSFGAAVGRGAFFQVEATRHHPNEFLLLVGDSARARKGSSWDRVWRLLCAADPTIAGRILTGLSSGEGLVWAVRDPTEQDPGARDPRLLAIEPEFASVLKSATREISTLSPTLRSAWDSRPLQLLTRTAPARATSAHISMIGHITQAELRHHTNTIELANGFMNRQILIACRRTRLLPEGGNPEPLAGTGLDRLLAGTLQHARQAGELRLDEHARGLWWDAYTRLAETHGDEIAIAPDQPRTPPSSARAMGLRRPLRRLGTPRRDRRSARRTDPRRADQPPRRADPHPAARPLPPQPARRPPRPGTRHARSHRPRDPHADPHRRPPRRTLDHRHRLQLSRTPLAAGCASNLSLPPSEAAGLQSTAARQRRAQRAAKPRP